MPRQIGQMKVGETFSMIVVENLTRTQIVRYAGASGDFHRLHTDEIYATQSAGFPSVFAHGMLTMGLTGRMLTDLVGDGRLISFGGRFLAQVWPGDTLEAHAKVVGFSRTGEEPSVSLLVSTTNLKGEEVFRGSAVARVDDETQA